MLPAVFALVETCIEALAVDTARAEAVDDAADKSDINSMPVFSDRQAAPLQHLRLLCLLQSLIYIVR